MKRLLASIILILLVAAPVICDVEIGEPAPLALPPEYPPVGELVGRGPVDVVVQDGVAYVAMDAGMMVMDVSDPGSPSLIGYWITPTASGDLGSGSNVTAICVDEGRAYLVDTQHGLWILDITDPMNPEFLGFLPEETHIWAVAASGMYVYLAEPWWDSNFGVLRIVDVSDPTRPVDVGSVVDLEELDDSARIALDDGRAYLICERYLQIVDVTDVGNPAALGSVWTEWRPNGLGLSYPYAYIASNGYLKVIDVGDPASPVQVGVLDTPGYALDVAISGPYAYVADGFGLTVADISDPANPVETAFLWTGDRADGVAVSGNHAYIANPYPWDELDGLLIVDVSTPADPTEVGCWDAPPYLVTDLAVSAGTAYVAAGYSGLSVVDVADVSNPVEEVTADLWHETAAVGFMDPYAYLAASDGLQIVDPTQPTSAMTVGAWETPAQARSVTVSGGYAYVTDYAGMWVIDVADPAAPVAVDLWESAEQYARVTIAGDYGYVGNGYSGLWILDLSDPAHPVPVSYVETPDSAWAVAVAGDYAYVADDGSGLRIMDVSNPLYPFEVGSLDTPGIARDVVVSGDIAYVADGNALLLIDISGPAEPQEFARWESPGGIGSLALSGGHVYAGARGWGMLIFPLVATFEDMPNDNWAFGQVEACVRSGIVEGYPDGLYHPEVAITRDQMAVYTARALAGGEDGVPAAAGDPTFPDVPADHWAYRYVEYAADEGVVVGYVDGEYKPDVELDRAQMSVYIARCLAGGDDAVPDPAGGASFDDVPEGFWAQKHVEYCVSEGVVEGYPDGLYRPNVVVTRDQMAVYVARAFDLT